MENHDMKALLPDSPVEEVERFQQYIAKLRTEKKKDGSNWVVKNPWMSRVTNEWLASKFRQVKAEGLSFDGRHITLSKRGVSYDYIAYKNKMFIAYPETIMDVELVYKGDVFSSRKENGKVVYTHDHAEPFGRTKDKIIGGYAVIRNMRGEFITMMTVEEFETHRKVAKTDKIWQQWYREMCLKTVVKKACKVHFEDVYSHMEAEDNKQSDPELVEVPLSHKQKLEEIKTLEGLKAYWEKNQGLGKMFASLVTQRKRELMLITKPAV